MKTSSKSLPKPENHKQENLSLSHIEAILKAAVMSIAYRSFLQRQIKLSSFALLVHTMPGFIGLVKSSSRFIYYKLYNISNKNQEKLEEQKDIFRSSSKSILLNSVFIFSLNRFTNLFNQQESSFADYYFISFILSSFRDSRKEDLLSAEEKLNYDLLNNCQLLACSMLILSNVISYRQYCIYSLVTMPALKTLNSFNSRDKTHQEVLKENLNLENIASLSLGLFVFANSNMLAGTSNYFGIFMAISAIANLAVHNIKSNGKIKSYIEDCGYKDEVQFLFDQENPRSLLTFVLMIQIIFIDGKCKELKESKVKDKSFAIQTLELYKTFPESVILPKEITDLKNFYGLDEEIEININYMD